MAAKGVAAKLARQYKRSPTFLLASWFLAFLATGTVLLRLPAAVNGPEHEIGVLTALFTAASAFCVTGLTVVETSTTFSFFGQAVIAALMELGGVGVMTFASLAFNMLGRRLSLAGQAALTDTLFQSDAAGEFRAIFSYMLKAVALVQLAGVAAIYLSLPTGSGSTEERLWSALFHSISAFCNAGFSIYTDNLTPMADNLPFLASISLLIILGGLGFGVLAELYHLPSRFGKIRNNPRWLTLNSRAVLHMTGIVLIGGAVLLGLSDYSLARNGAPGVVNSIFHSISARTAGFNSAPLTNIPNLSCLLLCILMFIGGAPGSCAGGVKVTSLAILFARISSNLRQKPAVNLYGFSLTPQLVNKARAIMALSSLWVIAGVLVLTVSEPDIDMHRLLFEQISAFATVGLSMGLTPQLNAFSQGWLILSMILGKFGPLTIALWVVKPQPGQVTLPEGRLMIG